MSAPKFLSTGRCLPAKIVTNDDLSRTVDTNDEWVFSRTGIHARHFCERESGMDLARYKGKTVEKWTALIPAASRGDVSSYGVLLVYKKKAVGAYLLEKPSGTVTGLKDAQTAMALQEAEQVSGEDFSGDWGERHEDELTDGQAQQTSGEDFSGDWGERHDGELGAEGQAQQTSGEPDAAQEQPVQYTDLPLDAEGYPVE